MYKYRLNFKFIKKFDVNKFFFSKNRCLIPPKKKFFKFVLKTISLSHSFNIVLDIKTKHKNYIKGQSYLFFRKKIIMKKFIF